MDDILESLIKERDEIKEKFEPMRQRLQRLETAIAALQGKPIAGSDEPSKRRRNVRPTVLEIITRAGDNGVTVADIVEEASNMGIDLEKTSVSTLVSGMKRSGQVVVNEGKYQIAPEGTEPEPPGKRGRKKKAEAAE